jgi:hypothetical protein
MSAVAGIATGVEQLRDEFAQLLERVSAAELERDGIVTVRMELAGLAERLAEFDARITSVSTELANQIAELGGELSNLDRSTTVGIDASLDGLRDAQTRLASEQARYQIAFRQDLADLADRLRPR